MNTRNGIIVIHYINCYDTTVGKTLVMYNAGYEKPPKNYFLFVAKKGGNVTSKTDSRKIAQIAREKLKST